jgi:hypothetical protein
VNENLENYYSHYRHYTALCSTLEWAQGFLMSHQRDWAQVIDILTCGVDKLTYPPKATCKSKQVNWRCHKSIWHIKK